MEKLVLIIWIALYPVACAYVRYIYIKKELSLDPNFKNNNNVSIIASVFEMMIYITVWIYLVP
jgi:uncharacterized membrane protein YidH (DUF202 family)